MPGVVELGDVGGEGRIIERAPVELPYPSRRHSDAGVTGMRRCRSETTRRRAPAWGYGGSGPTQLACDR